MIIILPGYLFFEERIGCSLGSLDHLGCGFLPLLDSLDNFGLPWIWEAVSLWEESILAVFIKRDWFISSLRVSRDNKLILSSL